MTPKETFSEQPNNTTDTILDNLLDAVLVVDGNGTIIYANHSAFELFQRKPADLLNQPFGFTVTQFEVQEINIIKEGKLLTVQMLASPIDWNAREASLLSLRDITAQKKLMEELEQQKALLEKTNEENAQYASLASHDLKEPVRKILMFCDLLLRHDGKPSGDVDKIERIRHAALRMSRLISGIAELSRVSYVEHSFEPVDLKEIVGEVCVDLELRLQDKEGKVELNELPVIEAVPDKIYQLFLNLISNSLKYARDNVQPHIRISGELVGDERAQITLVDNGIGFDNNMAAELFQPFKRLHKQDYEGIGIGLSLCQRIVEMHGGEIKARGVEGEGATFIITLPLHQSISIGAS